METQHLNTLLGLDTAHHIHGNTNPRQVIENSAMIVRGGEGIRIIDEDGK